MEVLVLPRGGAGEPFISNSSNRPPLAYWMNERNMQNIRLLLVSCKTLVTEDRTKELRHLLERNTSYYALASLSAYLFYLFCYHVDKTSLEQFNTCAVGLAADHCGTPEHAFLNELGSHFNQLNSVCDSTHHKVSDAGRLSQALVGVLSALVPLYPGYFHTWPNDIMPDWRSCLNVKLYNVFQLLHHGGRFPTPPAPPFLGNFVDTRQPRAYAPLPNGGASSSSSAGCEVRPHCQCRRRPKAAR